MMIKLCVCFNVNSWNIYAILCVVAHYFSLTEVLPLSPSRHHFFAREFKRNNIIRGIYQRLYETLLFK